jgi:flavin reductase (DIM6/NTAB) family NADH-FMN oxidoreductase RutF
VATFECTTYSRHQEGDHTILLGRVESHSRSADEPLILHMGSMGSLKELARTIAQ